MSQLPAHLASRQRRNLAESAAGGLNAGSPPHISIKDNRFTLVDGAGNTKPLQTLYLDLCIIDANSSVSKVFFDPSVKYDPSGDNNAAPICFSDNGQGASASASKPQHTSCQVCPQNAWGSAKSAMTGKDTKACNDVKKIAVVIPGDPSQLVYQLRVPPASLKNLSKYVTTIGGHGVDLPDVVTRLEFESQGVLQFTPTGYVDEATAALTEKVWAANASELLVGKNDRPWSGVASLPQADQAKAAYAQIAAQKQAFRPAPPAPMFGERTVGVHPGLSAPFGQAAQQFAPPPAPFAAPAAPPVFGQSAPPAAPFGNASPAPSAEAPAKRTRGPNKPKAEAAPADDGGIPPFLQRNPPAAVAPAPDVTQFGMQAAPAAPDAGIQAALDAAFRLPT